MILVDTNIWGRVAVKSDPLHLPAMNALKWASRNDQPTVAAQSLYEFWVVATRPRDRNGLGWKPERAAAWILACQRACRLLPEDPRVFDAWNHLVTAHRVCGKPAHDARLAAYMNVYDIKDILTFNAGDFGRYAVNVIDPRTLPI